MRPWPLKDAEDYLNKEISSLKQQLSALQAENGRLKEACKAIVRDYEDLDSQMIIDPASCIHVPNHTDLCPYWLAKQALEGEKQ